MAAGNVKGALVELAAPLGGGVPGVVVFQFNPETLRHTWTQQEAGGGASRTDANPLAVHGVPGETFAFTLVMDSTDDIANPGAAPNVGQDGVAARLAALELLLFPTGDSTPAPPIPAGGDAGADRRSVPASQVPTVLFVWGPERILPVRVTSLAITEQLYDSERLVPTHAEAQIDLKVLTPADLRAVPGPLSGLATTAYNYTQGNRQRLAAASIADAGRAVLGMLANLNLQV